MIQTRKRHPMMGADPLRQKADQEENHD